MKRLIFLALFGAGSVHAATVSVIPGNPQTTFNYLFAAPLPSATIRVGFFTGAVDFNCNNAFGSNPGALNNFVPLGEASSPAGYGTPAGNTLQISNGVITGGISGITFGTGTPNTLEPGFLARGTRLFLLVNEGFQWGAYSATTWNVPVGGSTTTALNAQHVDTPNEVFWGQLSGQFGANVLYVGALCPEPGAAALFTLAGACLLLRRRK